MSEWPTRSIPSSWVMCKIQDIASTATGGTPSRTVHAYFGGPIPWVKSGELGDSHVYATEETLTEIGLDSSNAKIFPRGTLCVALYGATVGKLGILEIDAATNQAVCGVFLGNGVLRDYVFHYLASIRRHLIEQGKGGAQSNISNGLIRETCVPIAPTNEQRRIVVKIEELFSDLDAGVAALERVKAKLKRYRAAVLKAAVEGKLTEEWRKKNRPKETGKQLLERILQERRRKWEEEQLASYEKAGKKPPAHWKDKYKDPVGPDVNTLLDLPVGWHWANVEQLTDNHDGTRVPVKSEDRDSRSGPYPYYGASGIIDDIDDFLFDGDYLLIAEDGANLLSRSTPIAFRASGKFWVNNHAHVVKLFAGMPLAYLETFFNATRLDFSITGSAQPKLTQAAMNRIVLPLPPLEEQQQIVAEVGQRLSLTHVSQSQITANHKRSARLRQSILKRAFEGKLVPQDPNDEPASVLLERISSRTGCNAIAQAERKSSKWTKRQRTSHPINDGQVSSGSPTK